MDKCIFLDKDGTLIHDVPYNVDVRHIRFYEDVFSTLKCFNKLGYKLIVVSNQSGIAQKKFRQKELEHAIDYIMARLQAEGISVTAFYYCPHDALHGKTTCDCRKPLPGMLLKAAKTHRINLSQSWMIGDILADVGAGNAAGCRTILLDRSGVERMLPQARESLYRPDYIHNNFFEIVNTITQSYKHITTYHENADK